MFFWDHEQLGLGIAPAADEILVALIADAYARTFPATPVTVARSLGPVPTRRGLMLLPDRADGGARPPSRKMPVLEDLPPVKALDRSLEDIADSYGEPAAAFVALTMESPWSR